MEILPADKLVLPLLYFLCSFSGAIGGWKRLRGLDPTASICRGIKCCFNITVLGMYQHPQNLKELVGLKFKYLKKIEANFLAFWIVKIYSVMEFTCNSSINIWTRFFFIFCNLYYETLTKHQKWQKFGKRFGNFLTHQKKNLSLIYQSIYRRIEPFSNTAICCLYFRPFMKRDFETAWQMVFGNSSLILAHRQNRENRMLGKEGEKREHPLLGP